MPKRKKTSKGLTSKVALQSDNTSQDEPIASKGKGSDPTTRGFYPADVRKLLKRATDDMLASLMRDAPFADETDAINDARAAWDRTVEDDPDDPELTEFQAKSMLRNIAALRGRIKTAVRDRVKTFYHFDEEKDPEKRITENQKRAERLLKENSFHFHKHYPKKPAGPYYCELIPEMLLKVLFSCKTHLGVVHMNYFNPMPLATIAMMITTIQFCITQWKSGEQTNEDFKGGENRDIYEHHYNALVEWRARQREEVATFQVRTWDKIIAKSKYKPERTIQAERTPGHYLDAPYDPDAASEADEDDAQEALAA